MANTMTVGDRAITMAFDGSTNDLDVGTLFPNGVIILGIEFGASAATDVLVIKNRSATGNVTHQILGSGMLTWAEPLKQRPFLDYSACTFGTPANVKVMITLA